MIFFINNVLMSNIHLFSAMLLLQMNYISLLLIIIKYFYIYCYYVY